MRHDHDRSVAELRRESEQRRAELSQSVEALRGKISGTAADIRQTISPENIKAEVSGYVTNKGRHWAEALKQQAMDNPMQALAAGTAIAVPTIRLIRSIPLPLLMIGAGLALTSPRVRTAVAENMPDALKSADGGSAIDEARARATEATDQARRAMHDAQATIGNKMADVSESATQLAADVRDRTGEYGSAVRSMVSEKTAAASEAASEALDAARSKAAETLKATRASAENVVRDNPALVGGIGLAIGALIAAALPSTRTESRVIGDPVRNKAADATNRAFDQMRSAADAATETMSEADPGKDVDRFTENATEKLKTITDEAVTTAFEPPQSDR